MNGNKEIILKKSMKCFKNSSNFPLFLIAVQNSVKGSVALSLYNNYSHLGILVFKVHQKIEVTMPRRNHHL